MCTIYAYSYNHVMLKRLEEARPEFFEDVKIDKDELATHMAHNMCLDSNKIFSSIYRKRTADIKEESHLKDSIRRLTNGGDKFHPYL